MVFKSVILHNHTMSIIETPIEQLQSYVKTLTSADIDMLSSTQQHDPTKTKAKAEWDQQYAEYSMDNLRTHNVIERENYVLVEINHPVSGLVEANKDILSCGQHLKKSMISPKDDTRIFYKLSKQVFVECCKTLESRVYPAFDPKFFTERIQSVKNCLADCEEMAEKDPEQLIELLKDILNHD